MIKKLSMLMVLLLSPMAAVAAQYQTNVNGAAVSSTNPLPAIAYGYDNNTTVPYPLNMIQMPGGAWVQQVAVSAGITAAVFNVQPNTSTLAVNRANTQGTYQQATIAPAATVATLTPPANHALEGWDISITSNATLATAGTDTVTVALNGVTLYQTSVYIPATALSTAGQMYSHKQKYNSFIVPKVGSAGNFTVTLGTALATGTVNVNEYSGN